MPASPISIPQSAVDTSRVANLRPSWLFAAGCMLAALAISLFFFSPRWWIFAVPVPDSTYWSRGLQFVEQAADPLHASPTDAGLSWRLAPAVFAWGLGLQGYAALVVPWLGLLVLLVLVARTTLHRTQDRCLAFGATLLVATTHATLTVTGWLGMNDAWYAAALLTVAFQPSLAILALACLIGPWIDERFVLALPLVLWVRQRAGVNAASTLRAASITAGIPLILYLAFRLLDPFGFSSASQSDYLMFALANFHQWLPWTSLGWFMGLRAAWVAVAAGIFDGFRQPLSRADWWPMALILAPLSLITVLAADTGRAPTMLLPLVVLGIECLARTAGLDRARRILAAMIIANLLLPAMHVTYKHGDVINMLPLEIVRLYLH